MFGSVWIDQLFITVPVCYRRFVHRDRHFSEECHWMNHYVSSGWLIVSLGFPEALCAWTPKPTDSQTWPRRERSMTLQSTLCPIQYRTVLNAEWLKNGSTFPTLIITLRAAKKSEPMGGTNSVSSSWPGCECQICHVKLLRSQRLERGWNSFLMWEVKDTHSIRVELSVWEMLVWC